MGGTSRGSRLPALLLLFLFLGAGAAAAYLVPPGTSPALDRVRRRAGGVLEAARGAAGKAGVGPAAATTPAPSPVPAAPAAPAGELRTVVRAVDGDTVVLDGNEKVRLIGINTPETVDPRRPVQWYGKEASAYTGRLLKGKRVRVEYDVERKDRYGRTLAYLTLEDGTFVNLRLVEEGYAMAYRYPPNVRHAPEFLAAEKRAREGRKGLWSDAAKADSLLPRKR